MSLGYVKGKYWVADDRYAMYASRDSYKALMRANVAAGIGTNVEFSYTSHMYTAEVQTYEVRGERALIFKHNNTFDPSPAAALTRAIRESGLATPLVAVCCLEIESELLLEAVRAAREVELALEGALDSLSRVLDVIPENTLFNRMSALTSSEDGDL